MKILLFHAHHGDPLCFMIKALSRSAYTHAAILIEGDERNLVNARLGAESFDPAPDAPLIAEAYYPHVRVRSLQPSELEEIDVVNVLANNFVQTAGLNWALDCVRHAIKYGIGDLFRFLPAVRTVLGEDNDQSWQKHTICSQFAFNAYRFGGLRLLNCHDYEVEPHMLLWSPFTQNLGKLSDYLKNTRVPSACGQPSAVGGSALVAPGGGLTSDQATISAPLS